MKMDKLDEIAKSTLEPASNFNKKVMVTSIYGVKSAMIKYHQSQLQALKKEIRDLKRDDEWTHDFDDENKLIDDILELITNLEDKL